jgi:hypothetical protein
MNWAGIWSWVIVNGAAIVAAVMVIVRLVESAIAAGKNPTASDVTKEFFTLG